MACKILFVAVLIILAGASCTPSLNVPRASPAATAPTPGASITQIPLPTLAPPSATSLPTQTPDPTASFTARPSPTEPMTPTTIASLKAVVTADLLSCRYGPGAEYLYLYGLRKGANIKLIGRTGGNNWAYVDGKNKCWVNIKFIEIAGDKDSLPVVYPGIAKLPKTPYYPATTLLSATRDGNTVTVVWREVPISAGDMEDEFMLHYIIEVWRCEGGRILFDPLATDDLSISFIDEPGCSEPSHGRVFVQEKHGFAGPVDIPWP